ncbi:probable leucine-rich repeat receptor-like protein kinase At5g63930 [Mercurialis annua]|uniref:probable leucine-rich repeat receptor-like protein kinase At5g63930 n=1 Tax=Mercurialis annua TaxID=3986 RepID=UPI00215F0001|nr:probable leucine-rich repeat receptor-like protein kinase At5g63930 [Mercurialis annua]
MDYFYFNALVILLLVTLQHVNANPELRALMEVKSALDPTNKYLQSWTGDGDPCSGSFEGVACNEHRKVANISLQGKGLSGWVSPALAELKCLSGLYLHYNSLSGDIPKELGNLTELSDLYLNVNNLSGIIPPEISGMASLQVMELCCNQLTGSIPKEIGSLKKLTVLSLQYNRLTDQIPASLSNLQMLKRLDLGFNYLSGPIPTTLANAPQLQVLDVRNNSLSGTVPSALQKLNGGFQFENNNGLCGVGFSTLRACTAFDTLNVNQVKPFDSIKNTTAVKNNPVSAVIQAPCSQTKCSSSSKFREIWIVAGVITATILVICAAFLIIFFYRRRKQKIGSKSESSEARLSTDQAKEFHQSGASPLVSLEYSNGWDPFGDHRRIGIFEDHLNSFRFNLEEIESATHCFSEVSLLGKSSFSCVYKGILRDGSIVAIRSISITSCKSEEDEFVKGLNLLTFLRHDNLVRLRGFCCSRGRGECFLVYDFAPKGNLSRYLDLEESSHVLNWSTRISIVNGIAKGIQYLHSSEENKPPILHRRISVEKILLDRQFKPLIADSGLQKLLADDIVYSGLKTSAAMGYLAPEYVTTGHFTEKSDIYSFGVIVLQILSGQQVLSNSMRLAASSGRYEDFIDTKLEGNFSESEAEIIAKIALACTDEVPERRPAMETLIQEMNRIDAG